MRFDGSNLKALRVSRKWDQHRLAEAARAFPSGITQSQISRYENGQEPSGRNALALAAALGVDIHDLYSDDDAEARVAVSMPSYHELLEALRPLGELFQKGVGMSARCLWYALAYSIPLDVFLGWLVWTAAA